VKQLSSFRDHPVFKDHIAEATAERQDAVEKHVSSNAQWHAILESAQEGFSAELKNLKDQLICAQVLRLCLL
jgi:hypothetical protein